MWNSHLHTISERLKACLKTIDTKKHYHVYECGVFRGESATVLAKRINESDAKLVKLSLFDTFEGMPEVNTLYDNVHRKDDFSNTSQEMVSDILKDYSFIDYNKGIIPDTFNGRENDEICFAHLDVDIYQSYKDCLNFIFPRLMTGGLLMCHDYQYDSCLGAQVAINEFIKYREDILFDTYDNSCIITKK